MRRLLTSAFVASLFVAVVGVHASRGAQGAGARARELATYFDKDKHKVKEKRGVRVDVFLEMRGEPAPKRSPADYTGSYESEPGYPLTLRVGADGGIEGEGIEPSPAGARRFTLRDTRVTGALLTGTKLYEDGTNERIEAVFINLTTRTSPDSKGTTLFGLGVVFDPPKIGGGSFNMERLFYALKR